MIDKSQITFFPMGKQAILLRWDEIIDPAVLGIVLQAKKAIQAHKKDEIYEVVSTYNSLLVRYKSPISVFDDEVATIKNLLSTTHKTATENNKRFHIPVCYAEEFGIDLKTLAKKKGLDTNTIIELHTAPIYTVYFVGFLPGFPYLGGLSEKLYCERKETPRKKISKGAVGIGGNQTGIYPSFSPGGWQLIGNCPLSLFDVKKDSPCLFSSGDQIKFEAVSLAEYNAIKQAIKNETYQLKSEQCQ